MKRRKTLGSALNPPCNWCGKKSEQRAAIQLPPETPPGDAEFTENGIPYGIAYWGCNKCLQRLRTELNLHLFGN